MILEISNLSKVYRTGSEKLIIFNNFSLSLQAASTLAITGESGSGKSTLLNLIAGLDSIDSGQIICNDYNVTILSEKKLSSYRNKSLGFIFQSHFLLKDFTALENVIMPLLIEGQSPKEAQERGLYLLDKVALVNKKNNYPDQLSGGECQRIAIARALANNPSILLADEPTGSLDEKNSNLIKELLFNLVRDQKKSLILVTHDHDFASLCQKISHLKKVISHDPF